MRGSVGLSLTHTLEQFGYATADHIVVRGTRHRELLLRSNIESTVIQDGVDCAQFAVSAAGDLREQLGFGGDFVVGLIGRVGHDGSLTASTIECKIAPEFRRLPPYVFATDLIGEFYFKYCPFANVRTLKTRINQAD